MDNRTTYKKEYVPGQGHVVTTVPHAGTMPGPVQVVPAVQQVNGSVKPEHFPTDALMQILDAQGLAYISKAELQQLREKAAIADGEASDEASGDGMTTVSIAGLSIEKATEIIMQVDSLDALTQLMKDEDRRALLKAGEARAEQLKSLEGGK
ncbi:MAG TPA: hypothetical protein DCZ63_08505 [Geobacter sp.]|nr:hypothetical protein [Geobacter sp.]